MFLMENEDGPHEDDLQAKVERLEKENSQLNDLCGLQKTAIRRFRKSYEQHSDQYLEQIENLIVSRTEENDAGLSYVVIKDYDKVANIVVATTPEFRNKFYFKKRKVDGKKAFEILRGSHHKDYAGGIVRLLKDSGKERAETIILDGKGRARVVCLIKHKPEVINRINMNQDGSGNLVSGKGPSYTRVDVLDLGVLKKTKGKPRIEYNFDEAPTSLQGFIEQKYMNESPRGKSQKELNEKFKGLYQRLTKKYGDEIKPLAKLWENRTDYVDFQDNCSGLLKKIKRKERKAARRKAGKEAKEQPKESKGEPTSPSSL